MSFGFLVSDRSGGNFELALADGGALQVMAIPGSGSGGAGNGILIFPDIAAMSAFDVTSPTALTSPGQQAFVQSNGSWWTLAPSGLSPDGITIVGATPTPETVKWLRENVGGYLPAYQKVTTWFIDPAAGNDENLGSVIGSPLKTKAELFRRWGYTWSPTFDSIDVTITYLSNETVGSEDPGLFAPVFLNSASLTHTAALPAPIFTGTLNVVTAKNRAANQALEATFTTTTGAPVVGMFMVNATRGNSVAWVASNPAGSTFLLTQPLAPYVAGSDATTATEVDTWAHGDAISGYALIQVDLARMGGVCPVTKVGVPSGSAPQHVAHRLQLVDFTESSALDIDGAGNVALIECSLARAPYIVNGFEFTTLLNTVAALTITATTMAPVTLNFLAGAIGGDGAFVQGAGARYDLDIVIGGPIDGPNSLFGTVYVDTGAGITSTGGAPVVGGPLYGPGALNVTGPLFYTGAATVAFPLSGPITIGSSANAYSNLTTAGVVATHRLAITAAALDAAAGAAGFGGLAYIPGIGSITTGSVAP